VNKALLDTDTFSESMKGVDRTVVDRGLALSLAGLKSLREEHARTVEPARALAREASGLERRVSDLVNRAYGLTAAEEALMWSTAPPRMPISGPSAVD